MQQLLPTVNAAILNEKNTEQYSLYWGQFYLDTVYVIHFACTSGLSLVRNFLKFITCP